MLLLIKATARNMDNIHIKYSGTYFLFCFATFLSVNEEILRVQTKTITALVVFFSFNTFTFFYNTISLHKPISDIPTLLGSLLIPIISHLSRNQLQP